MERFERGEHTLVPIKAGPKGRTMQTKGPLEEAGQTMNAYASEAMTMVTSGIRSPRKLRVLVSIGHLLTRTEQDKERETLATFIKLFYSYKSFKNNDPCHFFLGNTNSI
jgi:hypothetical protein